MARNVRFTGDKQLDAKLASLPKSLRNKGIRRATRSIAKDVLALAKQLVPIDSGAVHDSLVVRSASARKKTARRGETGHTIETRDGMFAGDEFYAGFIEYGWTHVYGGQIDDDSFIREALYRDTTAKLYKFYADLKSWVAAQKP